MRKRNPKASDLSETSSSSRQEPDVVYDNDALDKEVQADVQRSGKVWFSVLILVTYFSWAVYSYQYGNLPKPLTAKQAGKRGFSEIEAMKHVKALTQFGPHPVSSDALVHALEYVLGEVEKIKETAHWEVDVNVDFFESKFGVNRLVGGSFKGKSLVYSDISHIVLRILPKYESDAGDNAILVSSHIDTVFTTGGAGDCSSCVAVMLELARSVSQSAHGFKNSIIFLFNTGEEEGLNGAHSFITQHPWSSTIRLAIDLEAMGAGGKSSVFQAGPSPWAIENFALAAKYPSGQIIGQDLFTSGVIKSATDFQVYKEVAGLSGLDFAFADNTAVYHTKNDKIELIKPGSLQHLGENMLAFLLRVASSSDLPKDKTLQDEEKANPDSAVYFDVLGKYMIVYRQSFATMLYVSVIMQSLLIWVLSVFMGGYPAVVSLILSCLSIILSWIFSVAFSVAVAFILPWISSSPVPYASNPWMVVGLFVSPAVLGSISGQHVAFIFLRKKSSNRNSNKLQVSPRLRDNLARLEAERWLFKAGFIQWLVLLAIGTYYKLGSTYLALVWLVPPAFAYGLLEATLSPIRLPKPLKLATLFISLAVPILVSSGSFIQLTGTMIGMLIRFESTPGGTPEWLGNALIAVVIATFVSLTMVYLLSYIHLSGAKTLLVTALCIITALSLSLVASGVFPAFTEDTSRAVNVVHVVDTSGQDQVAFISLFSNTPGNLNMEAEQIKEGFKCGRDNKIDFVSFEAKYSCVTKKDAEVGWDKHNIPVLSVINDKERDEGRVTAVSMDTGGSSRWTLRIDMEEIEDFTMQVSEDEELMIARGEKSSNEHGWHQIQFAGGKKAPTSFVLKLYKKKEEVSDEKKKQRPLLKLRTDFNRLTPQVHRVLERLPPFCSLFGKSTSPFTLAFLASLPCTK
ncbi:PREDICTED: endoplasmic reticulum metallopeptidase 1-like isoform X1 [Camelina sativa]|uniref:Vacuolar membrane protease n=1 Tax=Camelina sativa TaxID=90675 RepID=A0ABM0XZC7_CAMSA|nr:PREDICTED: endoplasmic reticulum metallopeptidase 1-like isoform X2 [Camelina sativa]XP_019098009.1 PREDICTED: endoplasmic reticulum metallopeptidase 1-like isoform X1 [Camelina sativa]